MPDEHSSPSHQSLADAREEHEGFGVGEAVKVRAGKPRDPSELISNLRAELRACQEEVGAYYAKFGPLDDTEEG